MSGLRKFMTELATFQQNSEVGGIIGGFADYLTEVKVTPVSLLSGQSQNRVFSLSQFQGAAHQMFEVHTESHVHQRLGIDEFSIPDVRVGMKAQIQGREFDVIWAESDTPGTKMKSTLIVYLTEER